MRWKDEFWKSIKGFDTEEKLDLYFYRPFGFLIAKVAMRLHMSPTMLTFIGLVLGLTSGYFFYHNETNQSLMIASCLFVMSGVFDSSDGQLARMGGKSTKLGLVLDGLCDNLVFAAAYIGSAFTVAHIWGWWLIPISLLAGVCHSIQSSLLDFYNREYLYFGYGKINGDYWNPTIEEADKDRSSAAGGEEKFFWFLRSTWVWQQNKFCGRPAAARYQWRALVSSPKSDEFQALYRDHNRFILRAWRLMGANFHTMMIILFAFLRRFDLYLIAIDMIALTAAMLVLRAFQVRQDDKLGRALRDRGLI